MSRGVRLLAAAGLAAAASQAAGYPRAAGGVMVVANAAVLVEGVRRRGGREPAPRRGEAFVHCPACLTLLPTRGDLEASVVEHVAAECPAASADDRARAEARLAADRARRN